MADVPEQNQAVPLPVLEEQDHFLPRHAPAILSAILVALILAVFFQVRHFDFINLDDDGYVSSNARVCQGLTVAGARWAFTTFDMANWQPLTWLSHMLDVTLFGVNPSGHHLTSLLFHILNTLLLFQLIRSMNAVPGERNAIGPAAFVAALFAVHPLHVESVAWISERKDVLSAFFWLLTLLAYTRYAAHRSWPWYLAAFAAFAGALMAKPMAVTLPFVLLLLDYWPLNRRARTGNPRAARTSLLLVLEKVPFFALTGCVCVMTYLAQLHQNALAPSQTFTLKIRLANAAVSYVSYMVKMVHPFSLSIAYPHPGNSLTAWQVAGSVAVLALITLLAVRCARRRPYIAVGWLWYLGTLVPVIGFVQIGSQAMADRYSYIPLIGLFILVAFGLRDLCRERPAAKVPVVVTGAIIIAGLAAAAHEQAGYWRGSEQLFQHALSVNPVNSIAHNNLGTALMEKGEYQEAAYHFAQAMAIAPDNTDAISNRAAATLVVGDADEAVRLFQQVIDLRPDDATAYSNLGVAFMQQGDRNQAAYYLHHALTLDPHCAKAAQALQMLRQ